MEEEARLRIWPGPEVGVGETLCEGKGGWPIAQSPILSTTITLSRSAKRSYEAMLDHYRKFAPHLNEPLYTRLAWPAWSVAEGYNGVGGAPRRYLAVGPPTRLGAVASSAFDPAHCRTVMAC